MSQTMLISANMTTEMGQYLGDQLCSIKVATLFAQNYPCDKYILALSSSNSLGFLWRKLIDDFHMEVVNDELHPGNNQQRYEQWDEWRKTREISGIKFDVYKELYRRIDGGKRQTVLCGEERGLRRKNIFEYLYYGQEELLYHGNKEAKLPFVHLDHFDDTLIYHPKHQPDRDVLIAPHAKCQGNHIFTFDYWSAVVSRLLESGISVTVNFDGAFCQEFVGHPLYRKIFPDFKGLLDEICRHKIVSCGNTGVGWLAAAAGVPLLAMQPVNSNMADYRYELCGVKSLVEIIDEPNASYCAKQLSEECNRVIVFTTGCYDVIHAGHIRHLEESRGLGSKLIVGLNSDASVRRIKGENRPINTQEQRETVLRGIRWVDEVRVFDGDNALEIIKDIRPTIITNGCDHKNEEVVGKDFVESYGGRVIITSGTRDQSSTKIIRSIVKAADILKVVQDASTVSPNPFAKLKLLADQFATCINLPGDVADVGAYRGACSLIMRRMAPHKELHLFDTWAGNPHDDPLCHHGKGEWVASLHECKLLVGEDERTHYHVGVFPETAQHVRFCSLDSRFCFVVIDPDTHRTVVDAIYFFWPRLVSGGKLFIDDYGWEPCGGVKKAVDEFFSPEDLIVYSQLYTCVVVKK